MKLLWVGLVVSVAIALNLTVDPALALAKSCYRSQGHEICLDQVQRSVKYYWRYRVRVSIDGQSQPLARYDCRALNRTVLEGAAKGTVKPFVPSGVGKKVCRLVNR